MTTIPTQPPQMLAADTAIASSERRLWQALLLEIFSGARRGSKVDQHYLLYNGRDFPLLCEFAGFDAGYVRKKAVEMFTMPALKKRH